MLKLNHMNTVRLVSLSLIVASFVLAISVFGVELANAQALQINDNSSSNCPAGKLCNPLGTTTDLKSFLLKLTDVIIKFAIPIAALFIIWAGFKFVTARGDETAIKDAKKIFWWTIVGVFILVSAKILVQILEQTSKEILGG